MSRSLRIISHTRHNMIQGYCVSTSSYCSTSIVYTELKYILEPLHISISIISISIIFSILYLYYIISNVFVIKQSTTASFTIKMLCKVSHYCYFNTGLTNSLNIRYALSQEPREVRKKHCVGIEIHQKSCMTWNSHLNN